MSTSSRRSSRSAPPPSWKAVSISSSSTPAPTPKKSSPSRKKQQSPAPAPPSLATSSSPPIATSTSEISLVVAQPEQGKPLASASTRLPRSLSRATSVRSLVGPKPEGEVPPMPPLHHRMPQSRPIPPPPIIFSPREGSALDGVITEEVAQGSLVHVKELVDDSSSEDTSTVCREENAHVPTSTSTAPEPATGAAPSVPVTTIDTPPASSDSYPTAPSQPQSAQETLTQLSRSSSSTTRSWFGSAGGGAKKRSDSKLTSAASPTAPITENPSGNDADDVAQTESGVDRTVALNAPLPDDAASNNPTSEQTSTEPIQIPFPSSTPDTNVPESTLRAPGPGNVDIAPPSTSAPPQNEKSSPGSLSWFASFGRPKRTESQPPPESATNATHAGLDNVQGFNVDVPGNASIETSPPTSESSHTPPVNVIPPTPGTEHAAILPDTPSSSSVSSNQNLSSKPRNIPAPLTPKAPKRSGWFSAAKASSSPTLSSPLKPSTPSTPTHNVSSSSLSSLPNTSTSVDDEVPRISLAPFVQEASTMTITMGDGSTSAPPPFISPLDSPVNAMGWALDDGKGAASTSDSSPKDSELPSDNKTTRKRLSSLNPSTSRFTLSIPLLGRPKVPLEQVVSAQSKDAKDGQMRDGTANQSPQDASVSVSSTSKASSSTLASAADGQSSPSLTSPPPNESEPNIAQGSSAASSIRYSSTSRLSWWDYVPWNASSATTDMGASISENGAKASEEGEGPISQDDQADGSSGLGSSGKPLPSAITDSSDTNSDIKRTTVHPPNGVASASTSVAVPGTVAGSNREGDGAPPPDSSNSNTASQTISVANNSSLIRKAASVTSGDATASSWNLWGWYGYTPGSGSTPTGNSEAGNTGEGEGGQGLTESEAIKHEAIRAQEEKDRKMEEEKRQALKVEEVASKKRSSSTPASTARNPIESTIYSNTSGWASFFSSSSRILSSTASKNITDGREASQRGEGMEVMDIDEDEVPGAEADVELVADGSDEKRGRPDDVKDVQRPSREGQKELRKDSSSSEAGPPLTNSESIKQGTMEAEKKMTSESKKRGASHSPAPSKKSHKSSKSTSSAVSVPLPPRSHPPNLVLPTWNDTFHTTPRNILPVDEDESAGSGTGKLAKTMKFVTNVLFSGSPGEHQNPSVDEAMAAAHHAKSLLLPHAFKDMKEKERLYKQFGKCLPRAYDVIASSASASSSSGSSKKGKGKFKISEPVDASSDGNVMEDVLRGCEKVVVIGVHGWFPGAIVRTVAGKPTGTSAKFVSMMVQALHKFQERHDVEFKKVTEIPLEGEGTIKQRVDKLYSLLLENEPWMEAIHDADVIFFATHSQGCVVSTHILDRLLRDQHILTVQSSPNHLASGKPAADTSLNPSFSGPGVNIFVPARRKAPQRVCCLALCGIHLGPLRYLSSSSVLQPYFQYFESTAARELFEFQNTDNEVSKAYVHALKNVLANRIKMVYVASLDDQVVPLYSGLFTSASHPLILRALYIDGDAYHSSDFLSNLLVLLLRILNSGLSDSGLITHLSEATAGSLNGIGHSTAYEELATYSLAVDYLFLTNDGLDAHPELSVESFNATTEQNDYEIPWSLRDIIADERIVHFFANEIITLRNAFREWHPKTTILRDIKRKLQPIQKLPSTIPSSEPVSKL